MTVKLIKKMSCIPDFDLTYFTGEPSLGMTMRFRNHLTGEEQIVIEDWINTMYQLIQEDYWDTHDVEIVWITPYALDLHIRSNDGD